METIREGSRVLFWAFEGLREPQVGHRMICEMVVGSDFSRELPCKIDSYQNVDVIFRHCLRGYDLER